MSRCLIVLFVLLRLTVQGQTAFGIKGGLNISDVVITNYINPDVESDFNLKLGPHAGFFANSGIQDRVGLAAELLYSEKGVHANSPIRLHYIVLPLLVQYELTDHLIAEAGPEFGYLFAAKSKYGDVSGTYNNKFDLSLDAGLRVEGKRLIFALRYCAGLFSVRSPEESYSAPGSEKIKYQNRVVQFSVGYKIRSWTGK